VTDKFGLAVDSDTLMFSVLATVESNEKFVVGTNTDVRKAVAPISPLPVVAVPSEVMIKVNCASAVEAPLLIRRPSMSKDRGVVAVGIVPVLSW
jgi:hypothetical protein